MATADGSELAGVAAAEAEEAAAAAVAVDAAPDRAAPAPLPPLLLPLLLGLDPIRCRATGVLFRRCAHFTLSAQPTHSTSAHSGRRQATVSSAPRGAQGHGRVHRLLGRACASLRHSPIVAQRRGSGAVCSEPSSLAPSILCRRAPLAEAHSAAHSSMGVH